MGSLSLVVMKTITLSALSLLLLASSQLELTQAVTLRQADPKDEIPEDFNCNLCNKCGESCSTQCNLCSGCDLLKVFGSFDRTQLSAFGIEITECDTFCRDAVESCVRRVRKTATTANTVNNQKIRNQL